MTEYYNQLLSIYQVSLLYEISKNMIFSINICIVISLYYYTILENVYVL